MAVTLRARIAEHILSQPGESFSNSYLARVLLAPEPSVRRATLHLMQDGVIDDAGPASFNNNAVTYRAPDDLVQTARLADAAGLL